MKNVLITGVSGFVGEYLVTELQKNNNYKIYGSKLLKDDFNLKNVNIVNMDLTNREEVHKIIHDIKPDFVFHLAAQSSVKLSWEDPVLTANINIIGTINLLEELKALNNNCRILLVGSSEEYGNTFLEDPKPLETSKCCPQNIYAITKLTQNYLGNLYATAFNMNIIMTRSFNHFGPKQNPQFVIADFCNQVALIEQGLQEPLIKVGNLSSARDFLDVRDVVRAYHLLILKGDKGKTYNVGSGKSVSIEAILNQILSLSTIKINVEVDKNKFRPVEIKECAADITAILNDTDWQIKNDISQTIMDTLNYFRDKYKNKERKVEK